MKFPNRILPAILLACVFSASPALAQFPVNIGDLPPGKTLTITFDVDLANPGGDLNPVYDPEQVSNQGEVSGTNIGTQATNAAVTAVPINDPPAVGVPAGASGSNNSPFSLPSVTITDVDSTNMTVVVSLPDATKGVLVVPGGSGATVGGNNSASINISGTNAQVAAELAGLQYSAKLNVVDTDTVTVAANDQGESGFNNTNPGIDSDNFTVTITGDGYEAWLNDNFSLADITNPALQNTVWGKNANPEKDLWTNDWEFFFDLDPNVFTLTSPVTLGVNGDKVTYTFTRRTDLSGGVLGHNVEVSNNRTTGFGGLGGPVSATTSGDTTEEVWQDIVPVTNTNPRFGRVSIQPAP